jgi:hypothetical protein
MAEAVAPETAAPAHIACHGMRHAQQTAQPGAAIVLGEMNHQIVLSGAQAREQTPFLARLPEGTEFFPVAVYGVHFRDRGMKRQHLRRIPINQRIHLKLGRMVFQHAK